MKRWLWCIPVVASIALAGCGSSSRTGTGGSGPAPSTSPSTAATTTTTAAAPSTTATSAPPSTAATTTIAAGSSGPATPVCLASQLSGSLLNPNGAAGSTIYDLSLTNHSSTPCVLQGYPGVSFVAGSDDHQVGAAATRDSAVTAMAVTVDPGKSAWAELAIVDAENFSASTCDPTPVDGVKVYPPGQTASLVIPHSDTGCANSKDGVLQIQAFTASGS